MARRPFGPVIRAGVAVTLSVLGVIAHARLSVDAAPSPHQPPARDAVPAVAPPTGTARVSGAVVAADTGAPIRRARISLSGMADSVPRGGPRGAPEAGISAAVSVEVLGAQRGGARGGAPANLVQRQTETDQSGRFDITGLPAGNFTVTAMAQSGFIQSLSRMDPVALKDGESATVTIRLDRAGVITGRIVDDYGDPVVRAVVRVAGRGRFGGAVISNGSGTTDDLGHFRVFDLRPGRYQVSATANDMFGPPPDIGPRPGPVTTYYPGVGSIDLAQTVTLRAGQEAQASFGLARSKLGCVRGSAVDSTGTPIGQRGSVQVSPKAADLGGYGRGAAVQPDGSFSVCDVAPGDYYVVASASRSDRPNERESAYVSVTVDGGEARVDIQTNTGATVSGRVIVEGTGTTPAGGVPGQQGVPSSAAPSPSSQRQGAPRFNISVRPAAMNLGARSSYSRPATAGEDGVFELTGVRGPVLFTASGSGPGTALKEVTHGGEDITSTPIELVGTEHIDDLVIVLTRDTGSLKGSVTNDRGDPALQATVIVFSEDAKRWTYGSPFTRQSRTTGQGSRAGASQPSPASPGGRSGAPSQALAPGEFRMTAMLPGRYAVVAFDAANEPVPQPDAEFLEKLRRLATTVTIEAGETATVALRLAKLEEGGL